MGEEPVGAVLAVEAVQTCQADPTVDVGEQTHSARENAAQVFAQVVGQAHAVSDEILAGAAGVSQSRGRRTVGSQRPQPGAIGTQRVGQHESVEAIIFVTGRTVAAAQILDPIGADDDDGQTTGEQSVDHRSIGASDGGLSDTVFGEQVEQAAQARIAVLDGLSNDLLTSSINDGHGVIVAGLVDASGQAAVGRLVGQGIWGTLRDSLLAAEPSGEGTRLSVPERDSRVAH